MESVFFKKSLCALTFWAPIRMAQGAGSLCLSRRKPLSGTLMAVTVTWGWQDCVGIRGLVYSAGGLGNIVLEAGKADSLFILPPLSWLSTRIALFVLIHLPLLGGLCTSLTGANPTRAFSLLPWGVSQKGWVVNVPWSKPLPTGRWKLADKLFFLPVSFSSFLTF